MSRDDLQPDEGMDAFYARMLKREKLG